MSVIPVDPGLLVTRTMVNLTSVLLFCYLVITTRKTCMLFMELAVSLSLIIRIGDLQLPVWDYSRDLMLTVSSMFVVLSAIAFIIEDRKEKKELQDRVKALTSIKES